MALGKGIPVINGFDLNSKLPLDNRTVANTMEEMNKLVTDGSVGDGQLCYCKADKKLYVLKDNVWSEVGGGKSVPPTLWLVDVETEDVRTSITQEEKDNLEKGLYNQVLYPDDNAFCYFMPSKMLGDKLLDVNTFVQFYFDTNTESITSLALYAFSIGEKDTNGNYPITIEKQLDIPIGSGGTSIQSVDAYGEGGDTTIEKGKIATDLTGVNLKVPFVLNIYEDSTLSGTPMRIVMTNKVGEIYLGNFDFINHYLMQMTKGTDGKYSYASSIVPNATGNTLFNKPILVPEDLVDPTPILPCTTADNGKVLSVVNGEAQWANAGGGSTKLYQHNIVLLENSISEYLYIKHISSKQLKVTSIADLNTLLGTDSYSFECSGEVKINNTWYNAVAIYWGGSYAKSSVLYNVPSEGEKEASLTIYTSVNDAVKPI
jgi:hypothetical protein